MHTLHGRPLGFATGIKLANPDLTVICHMGDGESSAIGGNHLIQTARRNVDLVAICVNNFNYGMTGGQFSPTTPLGRVTKTSPNGQREASFDLCELVRAAGATYVARWTTSHPRQSINAIKKAMRHEGFAFVEIIAQCPSHYGRNNELGDGVAMMHWQKEMSETVEQAAKMDAQDLVGKIVVGEFVHTQRPEFGKVLRDLSTELMK
jgi:2-oxoglutarate ferredoxin oxidoreductase subunit beta